jgi:hypothetical protein
MKELSLDAPIYPGNSAAGVAIGQGVDSLPEPLQRVQLGDVVRLDYTCVSVWLKDGRVNQVGVRQGYIGTLRHCIGIGSSIGDVDRLIGPVHEDLEDNLVVLGSPGWCFETSRWRGERLKDDHDSHITAIFVFEEVAGEQQC